MTAKKQTKKQQPDYLKVGLIVVAALLAVSTAWLGIALHNKSTGKNTSNSAAVPGVHISLGVMDYNFSSGKAIKQDDANTTGLKATLTKEALNDLGHGCTSSYYSVQAFNANKTQVRLAYGCSSPDSPMFATKESGSWKILSPTNHFDSFGTPDCAYVNQYSLDRSIAPVCADSLTAATPQYTVR